METSSKDVVIGVLLSVMFSLGCEQLSPAPSVSPEQQKRLELMKSEGPNASLTILPVRVGGNPFDRVTEAVGWLLEQKGLKNIELGKTTFDPGNQTKMEQMSASLSEFVKQNPITTEYALYAEFNNNELRAMIVDKSGALVSTDRLTPQDKVWKERGGGGDLMVCVEVVAQSLAPQFGLNEETAKAAKPGKMAAIMGGRSGIPPEEETAALPGRQKEMKEMGQKATLMIFAARIGGTTVDMASAGNLAKMINEAGLCKAVAAEKPVLLKAALTDPNEMKKLWDLAREFRDNAKQNPVDADYVLYADYVFNPKDWEWGMVHFVVCDHKGEWVIVDMQNSHHPDYQSIKPTSREGCDKLLVKRLRGYLKGNAAATSAAVVESPMEPAEAQKVLDRFLGTWNWDATITMPGSNSEEKHSTGRISYTRILGGKFVQGTMEDAEKNATLLLYTYDQQRKCFRYWAFLSSLGGCEAPVNGTWNEATRTLDWTGLATDQQPLTAQYRFLSDDAFECTVLVKNPAGQDVYRAEYKMNWAKEAQGLRSD
jgi:hypothetical protein